MTTSKKNPQSDATKKPKSEKQKLWDQIASRPDWLVLERMRVNGFWPAGAGLPEDPKDELLERKALESERDKLVKTALVVADPAKALEQENRRRIEESRKRRAEKKILREKTQRERRDAWRKKKDADIVHLGQGVSGGLEHKESDGEKLARAGLPVLHTGLDVAMALGIPLGQLRWLTFHRRGAPLVHYHRWGIPKKTGGVRAISAPKKKLKAAQQWLFESILEKLKVDDSAHGFVAHRSVVTNALPHVKRAVVVNLDLRDFFPTITFRRVKGLFHKIGYSEAVGAVLALLCTEPPRVEAILDGKRVYVALADRQLPQGACTSPAITNVLCRRLDRRLGGLARSLGFSYTRYADDLTFSGEDVAQTKVLLARARRILEDEGFALHPEKTRVMRPGRRQEVTGVVVNEKASVSRQQVKELRAILHNCAKSGLAEQNREGHPDFAAHLAGKVAWVKMVDPRRGAQLGLLLQRALAREYRDREG
jgi:RNA-directed DNA polymerase